MLPLPSEKKMEVVILKNIFVLNNIDLLVKINAILKRRCGRPLRVTYLNGIFYSKLRIYHQILTLSNYLMFRCNIVYWFCFFGKTIIFVHILQYYTCGMSGNKITNYI